MGSSPIPPAQHSYARITRRAAAKGLVAALAFINTKNQRTDAQERRRPYFMPLEERRRLLDLILRQPWAEADYARLKRSPPRAMASPVRSFMSSMATQQWLLGKSGKKAYWIVWAAVH